MPRVPDWLPHSEILTYEEIHRIVSLISQMGVRKIRLSGGEPLVRRDVEKLVQMVASIPAIDAVSMTTNGLLLEEKAAALKRAGLKGVTVSLHSLKPERFSQITGGGVFSKVVAGVEAAKRNGLSPLKINAVIIRGCNDDEIADLAAIARTGDVTVRFIEFMPFDGERLWGMEKVVSGKEIVERIREHYELVLIPHESGSTANVYQFADGVGQIGIITSITKPFCSDCDRIRLSADGKIVPCLFDKTSFDLKHLLRNGASDEDLSNFLREAVLRKALGVESLRKFRVPEHVRPMHTIGG
jgi:cyclic pyranopterin phosphate synthase